MPTNSPSKLEPEGLKQHPTKPIDTKLDEARFNWEKVLVDDSVNLLDVMRLLFRKSIENLAFFNLKESTNMNPDKATTIAGGGVGVTIVTFVAGKLLGIELPIEVAGAVVAIFVFVWGYFTNKKPTP